MIEENGYPPLFYHKVENYINKVKINYPNLKEDSFFNILLQRKTSRNFDKDKKLSFEELSIILKIDKQSVMQNKPVQTFLKVVPLSISSF